MAVLAPMGLRAGRTTHPLSVTPFSFRKRHALRGGQGEAAVMTNDKERAGKCVKKRKNKTTPLRPLRGDETTMMCRTQLKRRIK